MEIPHDFDPAFNITFKTEYGKGTAFLEMQKWRVEVLRLIIIDGFTKITLSLQDV